MARKVDVVARALVTCSLACLVLPQSGHGATLVDGPPQVTEPGSSRVALFNRSDAARVSVGVVVGQRELPNGQVWSPDPATGASVSGAQGAGDASMVVGVGLNRSVPPGGPVAARLVWQTPLSQRPSDRERAWAAGGAVSAGGVDAVGVPRRVRMGLVLQPADPLADFRGGVLTKVQLTGQMALSLKPRAGGVWVSLNGKW